MSHSEYTEHVALTLRITMADYGILRDLPRQANETIEQQAARILRETLRCRRDAK